MLLTISTTHAPATDLGYLLHKHPDRCQSFDLAFGKAHVFYPTAGDDCCTAALLLDVDPVGMVRNRRGPAGEGFHLRQYVNDRPFVASSLMSVAIARIFGTALSGRCEQRSELVEKPIPLTAKLSVVPCRGGDGLLRRLFEPLGYRVTATPHSLDEKFPEWGESSYYTVELSAECRLQDLLAHLYVLIPVLDDDKHYWVSRDEVDKLLSKGEGWLESHPEKELIARRYLKYQTGLMKAALERLVEEESPDADEVEEAHAAEEEAVEAPMRLNDQRLEAVVVALRDAGAKSVVDLGCGEGKLLKLLLKDKSFERIIGMDVSYRTLEIAQRRLNFDRLPPKQRERIELIHGSLMYRDDRLAGFDAATVVEVIEHLDAPRLAAFERVVFECAKPRTVIVTTPNVEYNVRFETLPAGKFRHKDHRFEWTRAEFQAWANGVAERFGYTVRFAPVGPVDSEVGSPTQMGIFDMTSRHKIRPIRDAFPAEAAYDKADKVSGDEELTLCMHEFLDYARLRAEIARYIESEFRLEKKAGRKPALVGFLTGSIGPTTDAKLLLDAQWPGHVKYAFGLAHKKNKIDSVASDLFDVLDELYRNDVRHFVIADELVSGTQLITDLNEIGRWADERKPVCVTFSVLSFEELSRRAAFPSLEHICESALISEGNPLPIVRRRAFVVAHLLEKDSAGLAFRAVRWSKQTGVYNFSRRFQDTFPLRIRCCNGGCDFPIESESSVDQAFGVMTRGITQQAESTPGRTLAENIRNAKCKHCVSLLERAIEAGRSDESDTD